MIGGGLGGVGNRLLEPARVALRRELVGTPYREPPPVVPATFGAEAGLVGAALLARRAAGGA